MEKNESVKRIEFTDWLNRRGLLGRSETMDKMSFAQWVYEECQNEFDEVQNFEPPCLSSTMNENVVAEGTVQWKNRTPD